ncbi:unnamed protein product [Didymodactylos carnosus]|uniref:Uncharacterized protein n=1 Tax=Didymodactylos carnosus TaxID=1234261 RepID=A0A8S2P0J1_9BILA|nr:unnamed protein product [Didymodactylos carnosus]CAF4028645.1 unnamed protein product [Didymodactylos carnosus]
MYQQHIQDDIALQQDSSSYEYGHTKSMIQYDVSRLGNSKRKHVSNKEGIKKRCSDKIHTLFNPNRMTPPPTQALDSSETIPIDHNADDIQVGSDDVTKFYMYVTHIQMKIPNPFFQLQIYENVNPTQLRYAFKLAS